MRSLRYVVLFALLFISKQNDAQSWQWFNGIGGGTTGQVPPDEQVLDLVTDSLGNTYVCGIMRAAPLYNGNILPWEGSDDGFVAKFNCAGQLIWYRSMGSPNSSDELNSIAMDKTGNLYVSGFVASGPSSPATIIDTTFTSAFGGTFIIQLDTAGHRNWMWFAGDSTNNKCNGGIQIKSMDIDDDGNMYFSGGSVTGCQIFPSIPNSGDTAYVFLAKMDAQRNPKWYKKLNLMLTDNLYKIYVDRTGNTYYTGGFASPIIVNGNTLTPILWDFLLVKYDSSGTYQWHFQNGNNVQLCSGENIKFDPVNDHPWVSTRVAKGSIWGSDTIDNPNYYTSGKAVIAAIEFDVNGTPLHAYHGYHSISSSAFSFIDIQPDYLYFGGSNNGTVRVGNDSVISNNLTDIFITRINRNTQQIKLLTSLTGTGFREITRQIGHDKAGNLYLGGCYDGTMTINSVNYPTNGGATDMFLAKYGNANCISVGLNDHTTNNIFKIYPNPFSSSITILNTLNSVHGGTYAIYNAMGQEVLQGPINTEATIVKTEILKAGYYLIRIESENGSSGMKLIKTE